MVSCVGMLVGWCAKRVGIKPTPLLLLLSNSMITAETEASAPTRFSRTRPRSGSTATARTLGMCFSCAALPISSWVHELLLLVVLVTGRSEFTTAGQGQGASTAHRAQWALTRWYNQQPS